jgi:hypothetical protein
MVLLAVACGEAPPELAAKPATVAPEPSAAPSAVAPTPVSPLSPEQRVLLSAWYDTVGAPRPREAFGQLVVRAALLQLGKPYALQPEAGTSEPLRVDLASFECQSFVESTLSLARCIWIGRADAECFTQEVAGFRYRGGIREGFTSRLHYFSDWIFDNVGRGRLQDLGSELGGKPITRDVFHFTRHADRYVALAEAPARAEMAAIETRLSHKPHQVLDRAAAEKAKGRLESGDLVAIVTTRPGALISHTGLIVKGKDGAPRLLHASSHHKRVMLTPDDVASYIRRWPDREGLMVARPTAPPSGLATR